MSESQAIKRVDSDTPRNPSQSYAVMELARGDEARWDAFVRAAAGGTFYHLAGWRDIFENRLHHRTHYLLCEVGGELQAVLPLAQVKSRLFGNALISVPFLVYGGPLSVSPEAERAVVARACELARELGVDHLELRNRQPLDGNVHEQAWHGSASHVTFRKEIDPDPDSNLRAIPRKQRAMIRKGIQAGLSFEMDDDATRLYTAMLECKRNLGTPFFDRAYLQAIKDAFPRQVEILTVVRGRDTVCSVMSFRYGDEILPYYGGGGELARVCKGNDYMYWCVMEKACQEGVKVFDYGRSMVDSGAYRFKKHWGFEPEPLGYQHLLVRAKEMPNLSPANPKFHFAVAAWKRLPLPVAGLMGPPIARRLG
jgi:FemAB-related protein (PEP-CTERM system-associated)